MSKKIFYIMEQTQRDMLDYKKKEISMEVLKEAYHQGTLNFELDHTVYEMCKNNEYQMSDFSQRREDQKWQFMENGIDFKNDYLNGVHELNDYVADFKKLVLNEEWISTHIEELTQSFNEVINAKEAEKYKIEKLFEAENAHYKMLDQMVNVWGNVRNTIGHFMYSGRYNKKKMEKSSEQLKKVVSLEKQYIELFKGQDTRLLGGIGLSNN